MPMGDAVFALLPAPEYLAPVELAVKVNEAFVKAFEDAADLFQLLEIVGDFARDVIDATAQVELVGRLAPFGLGIGGDEFILGDEVAPLGMESGNVSYDSPHEGESFVGFGY